jgi:putative transposase
MTFAFVAKHRHIWPVSWMCAVLGVSRSGFHAWLKRPISARASYDAKLVLEIDKSFKASDRTYGARRVWRDVLEEGLACGLHRIERLMRQNAMRARPKRRGNPKDDGERSVIADNILDRDFQADRPNQKWLADFTYIWTAEGWLYVSVVLDLFSRRVVGPLSAIASNRLSVYGIHEGGSGCLTGHGRAHDGRLAPRQSRRAVADACSSTTVSSAR